MSGAEKITSLELRRLLHFRSFPFGGEAEVTNILGPSFQVRAPFLPELLHLPVLALSAANYWRVNPVSLLYLPCTPAPLRR